MRISRDSLSSDLVELLSVFTLTFASTASNFLSQPSVQDEPFSRVCELHTTLLLLETSKLPTTVLELLRNPNGSKKETDALKSAQELLGFMLNAEFVLYELYREYGVRMNPSLSHWVTVSRDFDKWLKANTGKDGEPRGEWGVKEKVLKIRVAFIKGILCEQGPKLASITPHDCASRGLDFPVDLDSFTTALRDQGIYEEPEPTYSSLLENSTDESGYSSASGITSNTQSPSNSQQAPSPAQDTQDQLSAVLVKAVSETLPSTLTHNVLEHLEANRSLLNSYPLDFLSTTTLTGFASSNPILARGIVVLLLSEGTSSTRRSEVLGTLSSLPVALETLDLLNRLLTQSRLLTKDESSHLLHGFLNNAIRAAETMGSTNNTTYDDGEYTNGGGGRRAQARQVQLIVLFVTALLRGGVVEAEEVFYEVQELGVRFVFVKEARELWKTLCG